MKEFIFTFGFGMHHAGGSLNSCFTAIQAETMEEARAKLFERRGNKFAFAYNSREEAGVDKYNLKEIPFDKLTPQNGPSY